jgi:hypothetical protein
MAEHAPGTGEAALADAVEAVGRWWIEAPYFAEAERHMDDQWRKLVLPFLRLENSEIDCAVTVDLAAGRGRTAAKLLGGCTSSTCTRTTSKPAGAASARTGASPTM